MTFSQLQKGQFRYTTTGSISTFFKRDENSITIKRADGWLVTVCKGDWSWDREVFYVN